MKDSRNKVLILALGLALSAVIQTPAFALKCVPACVGSDGRVQFDHPGCAGGDNNPTKSSDSECRETREFPYDVTCSNEGSSHCEWRARNNNN